MSASRIVCIAGGSGAGKSTLAERFAAGLGDRASVLGLDEYQKPREEVPRTASGLYNYDCPDAVYFDRFVADLRRLRAGDDVTVTRRKKRLTMSAGVGDGGTYVVPAREIVIVEGYLALWHPGARASYDVSIFLDLPAGLRVARRRWAKDPSYVDEVLLPMHDAHIEPTKAHADLVVNVETLTPDDVLAVTLPLVLTLLRE